jgi:hypothetical protein
MSASTGLHEADGTILTHNSLVGEIYRVNIAFIAVTAVVIGLRLLVRSVVVKHVAVDDYLMVAAGVFAIAFSAMAIVGMMHRISYCKYVSDYFCRTTLWSWETYLGPATRYWSPLQSQKSYPGPTATHHMSADY